MADLGAKMGSKRHLFRAFFADFLQVWRQTPEKLHLYYVLDVDLHTYSYIGIPRRGGECQVVDIMALDSTKTANTS